MKLLTSVFILLIFYASLYGQTQPESTCELQELAVSAALGDVEAQYNLGVIFFRKEDYVKAAVMWRQASDGGNTGAFNNLGYLTYYGRGVKPDYAEGVRLWRVAAEKGFAESQIHLAYAYSDGKYLKQDYSESYAWAKTGKHFAGQSENEELRKSLVEMAEESLTTSRKNLSETEMSIAEKKAGEYMKKFAPK